MIRKIDVSHRTIVFTFLFILGIGFLYFIRDILLELFVALLLTTILEPLVGRLSKWKIPRGISVILCYFLIIGILVGVFSLIIPALVEQTTSFVNALPKYLSDLRIAPGIESQIGANLASILGSAPSGILQVTFSIFNNIISVITVFAFTFYMLLARGKLEDQLGIFFGEERKKELGRIINALETRMGGWARAELFLMLVIGFGTFLGLTLIRIPYALPLAIFAGLLEIVPFLGPIISAIPSVIIGLGISPLTGLAVVALVFLLHQLEGNILVPKIMEKSAGISPIVTLIALAVGARLAGLVGMIISVPVVITLQVLAKEYWIKE